MWDKPGVLNGIASLLYAAAFLLATYGVVHYVVRLPVFPLREVRVHGELAHVTLDQIEVIVKRELHGNFFTLDLVQTRAAFEKLPWVRKVNARRQWPDRLEFTLEEQVPLARWGSTALVNTHGEVFTAAYEGAPAGVRELGALPLFMGPPGSAREIAIQYGYFQRSLAVIGQVPVQVQMSPRRAWQIRLASGLTLELGRERIEARLDRFIAVYDRTINRLQRKLDYADLRYPNGFAVRIPELKFGPRDKRGDGKIARGGLNAERN